MRSPDREVTAVHRRPHRSQGLEAPHHAPHHPVHFSSGQGEADTVVHTSSEGHGPHVGSAKVEGAGVFEGRWVPVGSAQEGVHRLARPDHDASHLHRFGRRPHRELHRRVVAEQLVRAVIQELRLLSQKLELVRVGSQRQEAVSQSIGGVLHPCGEQKYGQGQDVPSRGGVPRFGQGTEQVACGAVVPVREQALEVALEPADRIVGGIELGRRRGDFDDRPQLADMGDEDVPVLFGHAQQFGDDHTGERKGQLVHQIATTSGLESIQRLVHYRLAAGPHGLGRLVTERPGHEFAQTCMGRSVEIEQAVGGVGQTGSTQPFRSPTGLRVGKSPFEAGIAEHRADGVVRGQHPSSEERAPVDGRHPAQHVIVRVRVPPPIEQ